MSALFAVCCVSKRHQETMNSFSNEEFDCHFLDEGFTAKDILDQKINEVSSDDDKDAFYVADLGDILKKHLRWLKALPRVTPFYAVKCNDSRTIVKTLAAIGTGFDCASKVSKSSRTQMMSVMALPAGKIRIALLEQRMLKRVDMGQLVHILATCVNTSFSD